MSTSSKENFLSELLIYTIYFSTTDQSLLHCYDINELTPWKHNDSINNVLFITKSIKHEYQKQINDQ